MSKTKKTSILEKCLVGIILFLLTVPAYSQFALNRNPGRKYEPAFSEAVVAYRSGDLKKALHEIEQLLREEESIKAFELYAVTQKDLGNIDQAAKIYLDLIGKIKDAGFRREMGVLSEYDLAVIEYQKGQYASALERLEFVIAHNYNIYAARFFRGATLYQLKKYNLSLEDFFELYKSGPESLKPMVALQISQVHASLENFDESLYYLVHAFRKGRKFLLTNKYISEVLKDQVNANQKRILEVAKEAAQDRTYQMISYLIGHDSNVLSVPSAGTLVALFTGQSSDRHTLRALYGKSDSVFAEIQKSWAYQFSANYNVNRDTELGQFAMHDYYYQWSKAPFSEKTKTYRLNANLIFQNQINPDSKKGVYSPYSTAVQGSFSEKVRSDEHITESYEFYLRGESFLQDPVFTDYMKKSGFDLGAMWTKTVVTFARLLNPQLTFLARARFPTGEEFKTNSLGLTLGNQFNFSQKLRAQVSWTFLYSDFPSRPGERRYDHVDTTQIDLTYRKNENWTFMAIGQTLHNRSNIKNLYDYDRDLFMMGASYLF